jgi:histidinol-phosphatase (PHP family)
LYSTRIFFAGKTLKEAYKQYLHQVKAAVNCRLFDAIAHLDFIKRGACKYYPSDWKQELIACAGEIKEILRLMIEKGVALEVNTSGPRRGLSEFFPGPEMLSWFYLLGGNLVTVGSDTHECNELGEGIKQAFQLLTKIGLTECTHFRRRRPQRFSLL